MAAKTVTVRLKAADKKCKSCVRYNTKDKAKETAIISLYLMNESVKKIGNPKEIEVTIAASK